MMVNRLTLTSYEIWNYPNCIPMFNADKNDTVRLPPHDVQRTSDSGPPPLVSPAVEVPWKFKK